MRYHRVKFGDTLASIAQSYYGNDKLGMVIYRHNSHVLSNPNLLNPGQLLTIPHLPFGTEVL